MTTPNPAEVGNNGGVPTFYEPPQHELNYYHELFTLADQGKTGEIHGQAAVSFLSRSKLPVDLLRNIWTMVDHPKTNSLNRSKFFTAVRLIQLFQNGQKVTGPGLQSAGSIMRPPFFEGITGVSATPFEIPGTASTSPPPPPSFGSAPGSPRRDSAVSTTAEVHNTALTHDPYLMLPGEKIRYESLFPQYAQQDDFVYGAKAVELFTKSGLSKEVLRDIWNLVDNPVDNRLDVLEFVIAMHLIVCVSKKNLPLPKTLPFSLKALKDREAAAVAAAAQQSSLNAVSPSRMSPSQGSLLQSSAQHVKSASPPLGGAATAGSAATVHHVRATSQGTISGIQSTFSYGSVSLGGGAPGVVVTAAPAGVPMPLGGGASAIGNISEAFEGLGPKMPASEQNPPSLSSPSIEPYSAAAAATHTTTTTTTHSTEELDKVKAVLQKLQAENVSLKAQLGQYSEEEKSIRDEIAKTVSEIDTLSHDLTLLRSQVVEAKGNLIEATAELKAQVEKRDLIQSILHETIELKNALDQGLNTIRTVEHSVKEDASQKASIVEPPGIHNTTQSSSLNPFEDTGSVLTENFGDASVPTLGSAQAQQQNLSSSHNITEQHLPSVETSSHRPSQPEEATVTEEEMQKLAALKGAAEQAENDARYASDHANALALQFEDIRNDADGANAIANEKQNTKPKKKGIFKGSAGKKAYQKEVEAAMKVAAEKSEEAQRAYENLRSAQETAARLKQEAEKKRADANRFEMQLADKLTTANYTNHQTQPSTRQAVMSPEEFGAVARGQGYDTRLNSHSNGSYYGYAGHGNNVHYHDPSLMGFGGYPGSPTRFYGNDSNLMGGAPHQGLMGGGYEDNHALGKYPTNSPSRSVVNVDTKAQNFHDSNAEGDVNYMAGYNTHFKDTGIGTKNGEAHSSFPTDSSLAGNSDAGISYASDRRSITEHSNAGVSYASVKNGIESHLIQNNPTSTIADSGEINNSNKYSSSESYHMSNGTKSEVAPLPPFDYSTNHTGDGTDSSIQGSVSRAGTISEHNDVYLNSTSCSESKPHDLGSNKNAPSGGLLVASTEANNTSVHEFDGIPSPDKDDTFELNGGQEALNMNRQDHNMRNNNVVQTQNVTSFEQPNSVINGYNHHNIEGDAFDGIPSPDKETSNLVNEDLKIQQSSIGFNASYDFAGNLASSASAEGASQDSRILSKTCTASSLEQTSDGMMNQHTTEVKSFDGIPSPEKSEIFGNVSHQLSAGFGVNPSSSLEGGIPTPTASNSMTNPFGF